jgi:hypothetical protein
MFARIAALPVPLIVSTMPDDGLHKTFDAAGATHQFHTYNFRGSAAADIKPPRQTRLIFNIFGDCSDANSLILDHDDLFGFLAQFMGARKLSDTHVEIQEMLGSGSTIFLFLGFQFEELFTYPAEQILDFKRQLAEALYALVPDRYARALAKNPAALSPDGQAVFYTPLELKVVFSIRADRMSQLNALKDHLPNLLQHAYLLDALDEKQATEAVVAPAALPQFPEGSGSSSGQEEGFSTTPFSYEPAALALIFKELRDADTGKIETSALQIVCKHVEDNIVAPQSLITNQPVTNQPISIGPADLGNIKSIFRQFYDRSIASLPEREQPVARHLVEDLLIKDGIRRPSPPKPCSPSRASAPNCLTASPLPPSCAWSATSRGA